MLKQKQHSDKCCEGSVLILFCCGCCSSDSFYTSTRVLRRCHFRWQTSMFRSFLTKEKLDQDPKKYGPQQWSVSIFKLGWREWSSNSVSQVDLSKEVWKKEKQARFMIRKCCKVNRLHFNNISECITYDIWYHDLQVHIFPHIQSLCST